MKSAVSSVVVVVVGVLLLSESNAFSGPFVQSTTNMTPKSRSSLKMVDSNVIQGAGIAVAGLVAGVGLVAFTEAQGERAKERGGGISDSMSTQLAGKFLEDVEVSSVDDIGSLTSQLEEALKKSAGTETKELEMSEEEAKKLREEADDGW